MTSCAARGRMAAALAVTAATLASGAANAQEKDPELRRAGVPRAPEGEPFAEVAALERAQLIDEVLRRNPSVEAARAGWRTVLARVAQASALEDPMLSYGIAPLSAFGPDNRLGHSIQLEQRFPFPGKRRLRAEEAQAEAAVAREGWEETRLRLATTASLLYDDWYLAHRSLEISADHIRLVEALKKSAEAQYVVGRASQQDPLQAEVELSNLLLDQIALEARREVVRAEINGLLHRAPQGGLPPPVQALQARERPPPPSEQLQALALRQRPELRASRAAIEGRMAATELARMSYYPDLGVMGAYNSMWMDAPHQYMAGVSINIPISLGRKKAAVDEAQASLRRANREQERLEDEIRVEVERARQRLIEAMRVLSLHRTRLAPAARDQVAAARAGFESARNSFLAVIEAEKNLRGVELRAQAALVDVHRREAELQRALGSIPGLRERGDDR